MARRFLIQCFLLALPVLALFASVAVIDPYCLFHRGGPIPYALKEKNLYHSGRTMPFSNMLWKLIDFRRTPVQNILLGDSRLSYFDMRKLEQVSGEAYFNFGIPGGNYGTIDDLFAYADSLTTLRNVYVQVSFRGINASQNFDIYKEPAAILDKPWSYVYNRRVLEATGLNVISHVAPKSLVYDAPAPDQWRQVLEAERLSAEHFAPDTTVYLRLRHIAERCRAKKITLMFVEYPIHPDLRAINVAVGLEPLRARYLEELRDIAPLIDLDRPGLFPTDRSFWRDPLHLTTEAQRLLIDKVWGTRP